MQATTSMQQETLRQRLPVIVAILVAACVILIVRMILFQAPQDPRVAAYVEQTRNANYGTSRREIAARGTIYDRNGQPLAVNTLQYRIGISPNLISDPNRTIAQLTAILQLDPLNVRNIVYSENPWELVATNVIPEKWRQVDQAELGGITADPIPLRYYPQGALTGQVIGFVGGDRDDFRGYEGIEAYYQEILAGQTGEQQVSYIPFDVPQDNERLLRGSDIVLTLDRDIQFLAETELLNALQQYDAASGTIIVMNPRNGDILAMVNAPTYDPNTYQAVEDPRLFQNPAVSLSYEPGSVFKVMTVAAGLEQGVITPLWTYNDTGLLNVGGRDIRNWDRQAYGVVDVEQILVNSLNVGAATIAVDQLGMERFYGMMARFGFGQRSGVDLQGESPGTLKIPNIDPTWSPSDLGANSYGQGVAVTPLQMLSAFNAIANGGLMMQPRIVQQIVAADGTITNIEPSATIRVLSGETSRIVTEMMVAVVENGLDEEARIPGYTVAGKTGTAEIPLPTGQYDPNFSIVTFIGFLPADDPQLSILIKLDRPRNGYYASQTAAPAFARLAERLVLMLEIPTDDVRYALAAEGGAIINIDR